MTFYQRGGEKRRASEELSLEDERALQEVCRNTNLSPKVQLEHEKRLRREIANSNERRRMQSINTGFQSLKTLIPHHEGEKLSKAAILQQTAEHIHALEQQKTTYLQQNCQLKRMLNELTQERERERESSSDAASSHGSPPPKRKKNDTESSDEGISLGDDASYEDMKREMIELRCQLDRERRLRMMLEEQTRSLESQLYPERLRQIATQVQAQLQYETDKKKYVDEHIHHHERPLVEEEEDSKPEVSNLAETEPQLPINNSMSRRNLETIVEAIRHLEGDRVLMDERMSSAAAAAAAVERKDLAGSEESEKESMSSTLSDMEDMKSESSGRDSPIMYRTQAYIVKQPDSHIVSPDKYPMAMQLLHRPTHLPPQYYQRPGVIVQQKSS